VTEAGRIALDHSDAIFETGDALVSILGETGVAQRRVLRVGALSTLSRNFQIRFLAPVLRRDDVEVVVRSGTLRDLLPALEAHRLDLLLATNPPQRDAGTPWVAHRIDAQPVSLVGHAARVSGRTVPHILAKAPLILPSSESGIRAAFDAMIDRMDIRPRIAAEVDDMALLRLFVRADAGVAVVPPLVVRDELERGLLVERERFPDIEERFYAITPSRRFPNPLLRTLLSQHLDDVDETADMPDLNTPAD